MNWRLDLKRLYLRPTPFLNEKVGYRYELYVRIKGCFKRGREWDSRLTFETYEELEKYVEENSDTDRSYGWYKNPLFQVTKINGHKLEPLYRTLKHHVAVELLDRWKKLEPKAKFKIVRKTF